MKTVFIRAIEADIDDKAAAIKAAIHASKGEVGRTRFEVDPASFAVVPKSPFAYWASASVLAAFGKLPAVEDGSHVTSGTGTLDDFRFLRIWFESVDLSGWFPYAKGGSFSRIYYDQHLVVNWTADGGEMKAWIVFRYGGGHWARNIRSTEHYFRPGLTWPRRTQGGLSLRVMPAGCIFGDKGPAIFVEDDDPDALLALLAITNSRAFNALVELQMAFGSYEVGVIQRTPIPDLRPDDQSALTRLARRAWSLKRDLDTITETSHAFELPALLAAGVRRQVAGGSLIARAGAYNAHVADSLAELDAIQSEIDDRCFALYGISDQDRASIERGFGEQDADDEPAQKEVAGLTASDPKPLVEQLLSWSLGVALGRFDLRLATGERELPGEPEPFDPLPAHSPGMLPPGEPFPDAYRLTPAACLVDDEGHPRDLVAACETVFKTAFDDDKARWHEAADLVGGKKQDLRGFFAREFFGDHIHTYSKSRRKAPIYWQLATPSASYSVWCYYHRLTRDTFFRIENDYVAPKLDHEERKLIALRQEAGPEPSSKQRKAIATQESFVEELRAFKTEVARIAPLWNPNRNDGVIINFAQLWRLVPQHKPWQKECKKVWDKLVKGDYDWAHLAMHLWPERVVPKCQNDRSLAIAHGLEDGFWYEDDDGKWHKRQTDDDKVTKLISERASTAVKAALSDLLSAPTPSGGRKTRKRRGKA